MIHMCKWVLERISDEIIFDSFIIIIIIFFEERNTRNQSNGIDKHSYVQNKKEKEKKSDTSILMRPK